MSLSGMHPGQTQPPDPGLERIVETISTEYGFDIRSYKRSTLYRRIRKRMGDTGCTGAGDYQRCLELDPQEFQRLLDTILINVTEFFRDPEAWEHLQEECFRPTLASRHQGDPVRAWCVGCATGEEAYSLAIVLAEVLGEERLADLKIYATDVDESALAVARPGIYGADSLRNVSRERLCRFFESLPGERFSVRPEVRSAVVFGRQNVLTDPPISRLDILVCRNLLIYFDTDAQQQILTRFHYGLRDDGWLFLGKAETLMTRSHLFAAQEPRFRIFRRLPVPRTTEAILSALSPGRPAAQ